MCALRSAVADDVLMGQLSRRKGGETVRSVRAVREPATVSIDHMMLRCFAVLTGRCAKAQATDHAASRLGKRMHFVGRINQAASWSPAKAGSARGTNSKSRVFGRESRLVDETDARGRRLRELSRQVSSPRITYAPYGAGRLSDKRCPSTMVLRRSATGGIVHHTEAGGACQRKSAGARSERTCAYEKRSHARSPIGRGLASNACGLIELHRFFPVLV
jgi:hypothetical protein